MTPATSNIRELEAGPGLETKTPVRFIRSALPLSDFLQLYDSKKPGKLPACNRSLSFSCLYPGTFKQPHEIDPHAVTYLKELTEGRNYHPDLGIAGNTFSKTYTLMTANLYLKATCVWFEDNGFSLRRRERSRIFISLPPTRASSKEIELIRRIFQEMYLEMPERIGALLLSMVGLACGSEKPSNFSKPTSTAVNPEPP